MSPDFESSRAYSRRARQRRAEALEKHGDDMAPGSTAP